MGIFDKVMGRSTTQDTTTPGLEAAQALDDPADALSQIPLVSEDAYNAAFATPGVTSDTGTTVTAHGASQRIGQGPLANKMLPIDDAQSGTAGGIVKLARSFVGVPYVWGGSTPSGFDCSGFTNYIFKKVGIVLPRLSSEQGKTGKPVAFKDAQAGDLLFWDNSTRNNGADHVAVYLGGGLIAEAPRPGVPLRVRRVSANEGAWVRRVL